MDGEWVAVGVAEDAADVDLPASGVDDRDGGVHRRPKANKDSHATWGKH